MTMKRTPTGAPKPDGRYPSGVKLGHALAAGLATGAMIGFVAVVLTPLLRRLGGVADRDLINGASVVLLSIALWLLAGLLFWALASRVSRPRAGAIAGAVIAGILATIVIYGNIGPAIITPYPTRFASLAAPLIAIVTLGGALLFPFALRWSGRTSRMATSGALIAAVLAGGIVYAADRQAPVHYTLTTTGARVAGATAPAGGVIHFSAAGGSEASYTVNEQHSNLPAPNDAIGTTKAVSGDIWLTPEGLDPSHRSSLTIDLRTIKSDAAARDTAVNKLLQTDVYPNAVFTVQNIAGFPQHYQQGISTGVTLEGTLAVHGQQQPVNWTGIAIYNGSELEAVVSTQFDMTSFGIEPPNNKAVQAKSAVKLDAHIFMSKQPD
jgi:polyisoprenoid-binding protein YceI